MKTYSVKAAEIKRERHVLDATGQTLGRFTTQIAVLLMGKHKPTYTRNLDVGDFVVVTNAEKIHVTGQKANQKIYYHHSGWHGGLRETVFSDMLQTHPERIIEHAVKGMLPQNKLRDRRLGRLRVFAGAAPAGLPAAHPKEATKAG